MREGHEYIAQKSERIEDVVADARAEVAKMAGEDTIVRVAREDYEKYFNRTDIGGEIP